MDKGYRIKLKDGLIKEPLTSSQIEDMIYDHALSGEEMISEYPEGEWMEIGASEHFYDVFIGAMEVDKKNIKKDQNTFIADPTIAQKNTQSKTGSNASKVNRTVMSNKKRGDDGKEEPKTELYNEGDLRDVSDDVKKIEKRTEAIDTEEKSPIIPNVVIVPLEGRIPKKKNNVPLIAAVVIIVLALAYTQKDSFLNKKTINKTEAKQTSININVKGLSLTKEFVEVKIPPAESNLLDTTEALKKKKEAMSILFKDDISDYKKALNLLQEAFELDTSNKTILSYIVYVYSNLFSVSKRDDEYINSVGAILNRAQSGDMDAHAVTLADMSYSVIKKDYNTAISRFRELLALNQQLKPEILIKAAEAFMGQGDMQTAYQIVRKVNESNNDLYPRAYYLDAVLKLKNKEYNDAEQLLKEALKINSKHIDSRVKLVELNFLKTSTLPPDLLELLKNNPQDLSHENISSLLFILGRYYERKNNGVQAKEFYRNALEFWSANDQLLVSYEQLGGDLSKYMKREEIKNNMGDDASIFMMRGDELYQVQKFRDASMQYRMAVSLDEKNEMAWIKLGEAYRKTYEYQKAIDAYISAIKINKLSVNANIKLARVQVDLYNFVDAMKNVKAAQAISPENPDVLFALGYVSDKRGLERDAMTYYHRAVANDFSHTDALFELGKKNFQYQKLEDAKLIFEKILASQPDHFESIMYVGRITASLNNIEKAVLYFANQEKLFPKSAEVVTGLALAYMDKVDYAQAEKELNRALELNRYSVLTLMTFADLSIKLGRHKDALTFWETVAIIAPYYLEAIQNKIKLYYTLGDYQSCEKELIRLVTLTPFFPRAYYKLADLYYRAGKLKTAEEALNLEIEHNPGIRDSYLLLGDIYNSQSEFPKSIDLFRKLLKSNPKDAYGLLGIAKTCFLQKDYVCAETFVTQARQIDPDIGEIYLLECQLYYQTERYPSAANSCEIFINREPNHAFASTARDLLSKIRK